MAKQSVVLVAVTSFIILISQISQTEGTSGDDRSSSSINEDNGDLSPGQRNVEIDGYAEGDGYVNFNLSNFDPEKDQYRYKEYYLACESSPEFGVWQNIGMNSSAIRIPAPPHTNVTLQIRDKTTGRIIGTTSTVTPAKAPDASVMSLNCNNRWCSATVDDDCMKYNGNNVTVHFTLQSPSDTLKNPLVNPINSGPTVTIRFNDLNLLPFTNYSVTASLANSAGPATDPALTKQDTFITKPGKPGRVSNLTVTQATPSSLHVEWSAPDDNPPKGKLSQYKLLWMTQEVSTRASPETVDESVTSFNITGLQPNTAYEITISARNDDTDGYGEAVSITKSTTTEIATATPTATNTMRTTSHSALSAGQGGGIPGGVIGIIVVVVIVIVVAVIVIVVRKRRTQPATEVVEMCPQSTRESAEDANNLDGPAYRQGPEHDTGDRKASTNSQDETVGNQGSMNSLYEPFENFRTPQ